MDVVKPVIDGVTRDSGTACKYGLRHMRTLGSNEWVLLIPMCVIEGDYNGGLIPCTIAKWI